MKHTGKIEIIATALEPIVHGAGNSGNTTLLRTQDWIYIDATGQAVRCRVPFVSGNSVKHRLRTAAVSYALDAMGVEDGTLSDVDEYVSCIEQSDQALRYFLNALSKLDRKVVVVFWGDHQPFFPSKFNDKWFTGEDDATHQERLWQTDYIIWANYDVAGCDQTSEVDDLSTNYLSTQLMQLIGAPLTDYQKAHMTLRESLPAINSVGYEDASLRWALSSNVTGDDAAAAAATKAREDYAKMQYYEMFRDGKNVYTEHFQTEANETDPNLAPGTTKIK